MYRFRGCSVDPLRREVWRDGEVVHLEPQAFDLLVYLLEHRDRVVGKAELLDGVWGHGFLSDANLTTRVKEVRRAVGDDGRRQEAIANVRGRGYRFVAAVEAGQPAPRRPGLLGRDAEVAAAVDRLRSCPLVTLVGPGGVGKSTLARAIAAEVGPSSPDGSCLVELASLGQSPAVLATVARHLDLVVDDARPDDAVRAMARLDALVVLDNCEHVVDEVTELVERLLAVPESAVRIVATSRVRLGSSAESVLAVPPLDADTARRLFADRARAVMPSWDVDAVGPDRVGQLLEALDRLPLTIEMAAARLGSMTFVELEEAIRSGTSLLQLNHRAPARRHRSLESVVDWSAALLGPADRSLLHRFSVFAGPVTAADAAAVLEPGSLDSVRASLAALAERSLVVADLTGLTARYAVLATVRAVMSRNLAADVRARHAAHFGAVLDEIDERLRSPSEADGRARLAEVVDEARAAHRWAQEHDPRLASAMSVSLFHGAHSSLWSEPGEWARAHLERADGADRHGALLALAGAAAHRGDLLEARTCATTVAEVADGRPRAIALEVLADVALYEGDLAAVRAAAADLLRLGEELADSHVLAFAALDGSLALTYGGDLDGALAELEAVGSSSLAPTDLAWVEYARGEALSAAGDRAASACYRRAVELGAPVGSRFVVSVAMTSLATELARVGDIPGALTAYADALADFRRHGNHTHALTAMRNLVGLLGVLGDDRGAVVLGTATMAAGRRPSYGAEAGLIAEVLTSVRDRVGDGAYAAWRGEGRALDLDRCLRLAADLVDGHRA